MPGISSLRFNLRLGLVALIFVLLLLPPVLNALPAGHPLRVSDFVVAVTGKWICYAILALSIDLAWGYAGILGVYGHPILPDFMVFLGYKELPWYWLGFEYFPFAMLMALLVPGALAGLVGWLAFRSRITGVYLSIITQAMTYALMLAFFRNDMGFGGNNGFTDFKDLLGVPLNTPSARTGLYLAAFGALLITLLISAHVVQSKFGRLLVAIRDAESRVRFLGYDVTAFKLFVFVLSAMMAGLAGALYVPLVGIINPGEFSPGNSIEAVVWVAFGGRGTLIGAILGAFSVNALKTWLTSFAPDLWLLVLGALFIVVTLFLPRGLIGLIKRRGA